MNNERVILHLSLINGLNPAVIDRILAHVPPEQLGDLYMMLPSALMQLGIPESGATKVFNGLRDLHILELTLKQIEDNRIAWTTVLSDDYPESLKMIHMPPPIIYWQGSDFVAHEKCMAIVGSRQANRYGELFINQIVPDLVAQQWTIVSGGAVGADAMAHQAALHHGGRTVAVLGSGLLKPYPASNRRLFEDIIASGGMVLSQFSLNADGFQANFPARNRVISGLSRGCVVVQAAEKSGARITADFALEQGRDVFAVPGPVGDELSVGCHRLIQDGAKLVMNAADIIREYEGVFTPIAKQEGSTLARIRREAAVPKEAPLPELGTLEGIIVRACETPCSMEELLLKTSLGLADMQNKLFLMQLEGLIRQDFSGMWQATGRRM